jgi:PTS system fructose-specific IIC component
MAAVMLAGMVPPLALALATVLRPGLFTVAEHEKAKSGWALGCLLHHRGRHPVRGRRPAAGDPGDDGRQRRRRRPVGGVRSWGVRAPHGRDLRALAVINIGGYFIALISGVVVGAFAVIALKSTNKQPAAEIATV